MPQPPHNRPDLRGLTVLVVDHDVDAVEALTLYLRSCRAAVLTAHTADRGMVFIEGAPTIDAVVTEASLSGTSSVEFVRNIRRHRHALPVIALTALEEPDVPAGEFDAYLRKPVDPDELCRVIFRVIERRRT